MLVIVELPVLWVHRSNHVSPFHVLKVGKTQIRCADISSKLLAARQSGACDIAWASAGIDKFLHFMVKVLAIIESDRLLPSGPTLIACHEVNEFAEHCELELELDAVDDAFEGSLDNIEVSELNAEKCNIHENEGVDGE